jgi:hypothetical protein
MNYQIVLQGEAAAARRRIPFFLASSVDGFTPVTGAIFAAPDIQVSQDGAPELGSTGTVTELGGGLYYYEAAVGELATLGFLTVRSALAGTLARAMAQVVAADVYDAADLGLTNLDATVSSRSVPGSAMTLTSGERDSVATALLDLANGAETGYTVRQALRLIAAVLCGKASGGPTNVIFRNLGDTANRVVTIADGNGNRSTVTLLP